MDKPAQAFAWAKKVQAPPTCVKTGPPEGEGIAVGAVDVLSALRDWWGPLMEHEGKKPGLDRVVDYHTAY
eukprot:8822880-Alexandrium_andersonii.AAC.1